MSEKGKAYKSIFEYNLENEEGIPVIIYKKWNTAEMSSVESRAIKQSNAFELSLQSDINIGDVIQPSGSRSFWKVVDIDEHIKEQTMIKLVAKVVKIDNLGNEIEVNSQGKAVFNAPVYGGVQVGGHNNSQTNTQANNSDSAWLWFKHSEGLIRDFRESESGSYSVIQEWRAFDWYKGERAYKQKVKDIYGWTRVLGKLDRISLEGIYTDVFIIDKPRAFRHYDISNLTSQTEIIHKDEKRINGLDLIKKKSQTKIFILGKPGAGKTTFLKFLTYQATLGKINKTPIFISLKEWADSNFELMEFIYRQFDICGFPEKDAQPFIDHLLTDGKALILFDGLDEVNLEGGSRQRINYSITEFCRKYNKNQVLITCRIAANEYVFEDFSYVELADFTTGQVKQYVDKWFSEFPQKRENFEREISKPENQAIRRLANTPILLTLLCLTFDNIQTFPPRKVEIYEEALEALLKKWDASRQIKRDEIYKDLSPKRKQQMIARIAARTFENNEYYIPKDKLARYICEYLAILPNSDELDIDGEVVLKAIEAQHGIFTERAKNIYSFSHLTFQEYFTAKYIIDNRNNDTLRKLLKIKHITAPNWREVILNTASLLDDANDFFFVFQRFAKDIIKDDKKTKGFLDWVEKKPQKTNSNLDAIEIREHYFNIGIELHSVEQAMFSSLKKKLAQNLYKKNAQTESKIVSDTLTNFLNNKSLKIRIISDSLKKFFRDKNLDFILQENPELRLDFELWTHFITISILISICELYPEQISNNAVQKEIELILSSLSGLINNLKLHYKTDATNLEIFNDLQINSELIDLRKCHKIISEFMINKRGINVNLSFSENQKELLKQYSNVTKLIKNCMDLAVLSDRKSITNRLYTTLG